MMKTLYILRHAKSSWKFEGLSDQDRPLNKRGREDAQLMGQELASRGLKPDLILASPAVRALTTATLVGKELGYQPEDIVLDERVYAAGIKDLMEVVQETPKDVQSLLLVGHNEGISDFANELSPENLARLPTAGIVALQFDCDNWTEISRDNADFLFFDFPKNYK
ncbi:SixA phosphatase family protein [Pontibacter liquoris]|uniref:SixA phosphatase family protein n=1 Tax=Pontibacter liquoris TaxID=2905677 RepID=UPI001FA7F802|nr:histidine phosphatase family protein [Pontibacter liquoris]